jgi:4-amino-4-deoxy-L-arabinose transferase-like glycosyltransferase
MPSSSPFRRFLRSDTAALWGVGLAFTVLHIATSGRYGFHRDELLTYTNARHLDWCYVVYPPVTAWLARLELEIFGASLVGFRSFAAISTGLVAIFAGLIARALGGNRQAMLVTAVAASIAGPVVFAGTFLSYMTFDLVCWVAVAWCAARLLQAQDPRWWIGIGTAVGLGMICKYTMLFLAAGVLGGMLFTPIRRYLRSVWFWCGIAIALAIFSPVIVWQFHHHFVGLDWMKSIHARDIRWGRTQYFLLNQFWSTTNLITVPLWCAGLWYLFATSRGKPFRMIGWMYVIPLVTYVVARGRDYYLAPAYPMLFAAGAVQGEQWLARLNAHAQAAALRITWISLLIGGAIAISLVAPIAPVNTPWWRMADAVTGNFNMEFGWQELAATVAKVRDSLPGSQRAHVAILAGDEGEAGAVNLYGPAYKLPEAISGMNSNWLRGYGNPPPQSVIAVGMDHDFLESNFLSCVWAARLSNRYGVENSTIDGYSNVYVCGSPRQGWPDFWAHFQYFG